MLGGLQPVIIFQFSALQDALSEEIAKIPVISQIPTVIDQPPIPIYLDENTFGIVIDQEDKTVSIQTDVETKSDGSDPDVHQKGISNSINIQMRARKDSLVLTLLSAMVDLVFPKLTSKEYSITYLSGPITIFRAVLQDFSIQQSADSDMVSIRIELSKGQSSPAKKTLGPTLPGITGALPSGIQ